MFALVVRFGLHDQAAADAFDKVVAELVTKIATNERGTLVYATHHVDGDPLARIFYEVYESRTALDVHEAQPWTREFLDNRHLYVKDTRVEFLSDGPAKGLPL
ncbi:putative quinol monooxygenase [Nocardia sp. XZ_19_231]|uniref:putative quinol monooxygenase n=1 Tax=Nocardia sp. XZ_19_231 TaxID=2769252 RepID=UPI00188E3D0A|nr:antibiotic biosynthesis monooxygenase [Nocardia sp. XZ_19_231]